MQWPSRTAPRTSQWWKDGCLNGLITWKGIKEGGSSWKMASSPITGRFWCISQYYPHVPVVCVFYYQFWVFFCVLPNLKLRNRSFVDECFFFVKMSSCRLLLIAKLYMVSAYCKDWLVIIHNLLTSSVHKTLLNSHWLLTRTYNKA